MTDLATRPGFDFYGFPLPTTTGPRCGNCGGGVHHADVAAVKLCYALEAEQSWDDGAAAAEAAYERHLEDRGYDEARAQDDHEARNGVVGFIDAWHAESPDTCPCDRH